MGSTVNEAEVRAKIVDLWLRDHGFTAGQIVLEKTFSIRLGRGLYEVGKKRSSRNDDLRGRADYLVRSSDGRNLFIVEAKAAEEEIDDDSCRQAISYARLLDQGGIAPFVVVTNGTQTRIIDSITRESLQGHCIPTSHPYISAGFRVSVDDLTYRTEALEQLICLSPENFLAFCRLQSDMRMARLRSNDITSGFKYIPSLYVERQTAHKELTNLIETDGKCVILLGPPQVGKTNFLCHFVEAQLALGTPCLFYPAIGMDSGLLDAIREDFDWTFSEAGSISQMVRQKLRRVLENSCKKLLLVVEGLNENQNFVNAFTAECERLQSEKICLILSFTTHSAASILLDAAGNPTYAARATGIHKRDIPVLQMNPLAHSNHRAVVNIGVFSEEEIETAYSTYSDAFRVVVPGDHGRTSEPLVLRIAMERFQGQHLPVKLDAAELLDWTINEKLSRLSGVRQNAGRATLEEIGRRICDDEVVTEFWFQQNGLLLEKFIDAAILSRHGVAGGRTIIDFYVTSERAYVIAYWVRQWHRLLRRPVADCQTELSLIARNGAMAEAFRWFVRQVPNRDILRELGEAIQRVEDRAARVLIALILCDYLAYAKREDQERDDEEHEKLSEFFDELTMKARDGQTELTDVLVHLISDPDEELEVRRTCAVGLGTFDPELCLRSLALGLGGSRNPQEIVVQSLEPGFRQAVDGIIEMYYGNPLCPSYLESLEGDEERSLEEYNRLIDCGRSAIQLFRFSNSAKEFEDLLCILNPQHHPFPDYRKQRNLFD